MFKPRQTHRQRNQQSQNPLSDMEQYYLHQYFSPKAGSPILNSYHHPYANSTNDRFPPVEIAKLQQLELRIAQIEQYLGLATANSSPNTFIR